MTYPEQKVEQEDHVFAAGANVGEVAGHPSARPLVVVVIVVHLGGCWVVGADKSLGAAVRGARFTTFDQVRCDGRLDILVGIEGRSPVVFRPTSWADRRELLREVDGNHNKTAIFDLRLCAIALPCVGAATWMGHSDRDFYTDLAHNRRAIVCFCCAYINYG